DEFAILVLGQQAVPLRTPDDLDDIPAGAAIDAFQFLDDLGVAAHRTVEALQVAVDDENEVVQAFAGRHIQRTQRFRLVHFAVATEAPDLAPGVVLNTAVLHVAHETRIVNGGNRADAHGHGGELPVIGHQPSVGIARQPAFFMGFPAETGQLVFA